MDADTLKNVAMAVGLLAGVAGGGTGFYQGSEAERWQQELAQQRARWEAQQIRDSDLCNDRLENEEEECDVKLQLVRFGCSPDPLDGLPLGVPTER